MSHTRIFRWADVPDEWAEHAEAMEPRDWLAVVAGDAFTIHWTEQVRYQATPDTLLIAGNEPDWGRP